MNSVKNTTSDERNSLNVNKNENNSVDIKSIMNGEKTKQAF